MARLKTKEPVRRLEKGEYYRESDGVYYCYYYDDAHNRKKLTSKDLDVLREKRIQIENLRIRNVKISARAKTLDDCYAEWLALKRGVTEHTKSTYTWMYEHYVQGTKLGKKPIQDITIADIQHHYNALNSGPKCLKISTIDSLHTVVSQVCKHAIGSKYIASDPSVGAMSGLNKEVEKKQAHEALTKAQQERFICFIEGHPIYDHWAPVFKVLLGTGMRSTEVCGLRWKDIDLEAGTITVDHNLLYYCSNADKKTKTYIGKTKTKASNRTIVMLDSVKEAFQKQREYLDATGLKCNVILDGVGTPETVYTDFIFLNRHGSCQHKETLNKALRKIIRDANLEAMHKEGTEILPDFTCHNFRSTYITRSAEAGVDINVTMAQVGHSDSEITMQIYTTVNPDWKKRELKNLQGILG